MNKVQILREVIKKLVPMIASRGIRVTQVGAQAFVQTDPVTLQPVRVNIPHLPDDADERLCFAIQGFIDHELGHVLDTDWSVVAEQKPKGRALAASRKMHPEFAAQRMHELANLIEDPYVERKMSERFQGAAYNVGKLHDIFIERISKPAIDGAKNPEERFGCIIVPLVRAWAGQEKFQRLLDDNGYMNDPLVEAFVRLVPESLKEALKTTQSTADCAAIAAQLFDIIHPEPPPAPAPPPGSPPTDQNDKDDQSPSQPSDDTEKGEESDGEGNNQDKPEDENDKGSDGESQKDQPADDQEGSDGEKSEEAEETEDDEGQSSDAESDGDDEVGGDDAGAEDEAEEGSKEDEGSAGEDSDDRDSDGDSSGGSDDKADEEASDEEAEASNDDGTEGDEADQDGNSSEADPDDDGSEDDNGDGSEGDTDDSDDDESDTDSGEGSNEERSDDGESPPGSDDDQGGDDSDGEDEEAASKDSVEGDSEGDQREGDDAEGAQEAEGGEKTKADPAEGNDEAEVRQNETEQEAPESNPFMGTALDKLGDDLTKGIQFIITNEATREIRDADYRVYTTEWDVCEKFPVPTPEEFEEAQQKRYGRRHRNGSLNVPKLVEGLEELTRSMIAPMQKDIERMMAARSQIIKVPGFRSGRLHSGSLHRLRVNDDRVFRRITENKTLETAVTLLIDNSGSMSGAKMKIAMAAGYALSSTLERVGIKHEVMGFTTKDVEAHQHAEQQAEEDRIGRPFSRMGALYHPIYKGFDERLSPRVKQRFAVAPVSCPMGGNTDGESIRFASNRLALRNEPRKVMIVLSDGNPAAMSCFTSEIYADVHRAVAECDKKGIEIVGLGILDNAVKTFYPKCAVLNDLSELPKAVMGEMKRILAA